MKTRLKIAALLCAVLALEACSGGEESRVPTEDENRKLNEISATLDNQQTIDTSPDSLTVDEPPVGNEAAPVEVENSAAQDLANAQ
jgi:hypothetical protein